MLKVDTLTKTFGQKNAVDNVSFTVDRSSMIGVIGRSGAGKSTFLRMMNGLASASSGSIHFEGEDVTALKGADLRVWQSRCAMIFQQFNLLPFLSAKQNILLAHRCPTIYRIMAVRGWRNILGDCS